MVRHEFHPCESGVPGRNGCDATKMVGGIVYPRHKRASQHDVGIVPVQEIEVTEDQGIRNPGQTPMLVGLGRLVIEQEQIDAHGHRRHSQVSYWPHSFTTYSGLGEKAYRLVETCLRGSEQENNAASGDGSGLGSPCWACLATHALHATPMQSPTIVSPVA